MRRERIPSERPEKQMRIALLGNFGTQNFGNDASLEAMLDALRRLAPGPS